MVTTITNALVTAYCAGTICANGHAPIEGTTVAGPRNVPLGTHVIISGHRYIVQDRTARRYDGRYDIYMRSRTMCITHGITRERITILPRRVL